MGRFYLVTFLFRRLVKPGFWLVFLSLLGFFFYSQLFKISDGRFHLRFLDVGQGDAVFITTGRGQRILIDGGPDSKAATLVDRILPFNDKSLDLVILTHPHADHVGGLVAVLDSYDVRNLVFEGGEYPSQTFGSFLDLVEEQKRRGARVYKPKAGDILTLGEVKIKIFWPDNWDRTANLSNANDHSLVSLVSYGDFDVFLPGDQELSEANKMLGAQLLPSVEVLKVAHHGSRNGLNGALLDLLRPDLVVISAGRNNAYGHPHPETLDLISRFGARLLRTDLSGTIELVSDGKSWGIR